MAKFERGQIVSFSVTGDESKDNAILEKVAALVSPAQSVNERNNGVPVLSVLDDNGAGRCWATTGSTKVLWGEKLGEVNKAIRAMGGRCEIRPFRIGKSGKGGKVEITLDGDAAPAAPLAEPVQPTKPRKQ